MTCRIEVLFVPAEFREFTSRERPEAVCVVFDVLRATSTIATALAQGAAAVVPVEEIAEALDWRRRNPAWLLAGEREGWRIGAALTGGVEFDLGNSPREFTAEKIAGRTIIMTTTNGTRALRGCRGARAVFACCFLNLAATARAVLPLKPQHLLLVCAGTGEGSAFEDVLAAGAFCGAFSGLHGEVDETDSAIMARELYLASQNNLEQAASRSQNGRLLLRIPELREDVAFCLQRDTLETVATLGADGAVRKCGDGAPVGA